MSEPQLHSRCATHDMYRPRLRLDSRLASHSSAPGAGSEAQLRVAARRYLLVCASTHSKFALRTLRRDHRAGAFLRRFVTLARMRSAGKTRAIATIPPRTARPQGARARPAPAASTPATAWLASIDAGLLSCSSRTTERRCRRRCQRCNRAAFRSPNAARCAPAIDPTSTHFAPSRSCRSCWFTRTSPHSAADSWVWTCFSSFRVF